MYETLAATDLRPAANETSATEPAQTVATALASPAGPHADQAVQAARMAAVGDLAAGVVHEINNPLFAILGLVEFLLADAEPGTKAHERLRLIQETGLEIKAIARALLARPRRPRHRRSRDGRALPPHECGTRRRDRPASRERRRGARQRGPAQAIAPAPARERARGAPAGRHRHRGRRRTRRRGRPRRRGQRLRHRRAGPAAGLRAVLHHALRARRRRPWPGGRPRDRRRARRHARRRLRAGLRGPVHPPSPGRPGHGVIGAQRILVLDDERVVRELMVEILQAAGYHAFGVERADEALDLLVDDAEGVSLIVSDIFMPGVSGFELIEAVRARRPSLPVVLVTGAGTQGNLSEALARGADGLVTKPFTHAELIATVENVLQRAARSERELRDRVVTPTLAGALANAIEAREASLHGHCERLATVALRIADQLDLPLEDRETIRLGAILHDVGKIGIPDAILLKPGPLTADEWAVMRRHTLIGDGLLAPLGLREGLRAVVRHHHERWDGTGYPDELAGDAIPLSARVIAVADSIEAMAADRPYRRALPLEEIAEQLRLGRGTQWDPLVTDAAVRLVEAGGPRPPR